VVDEEPEPIHFLRNYSNYLAPRPGLFSADGWVLIAIYLRNLLLNQLVMLLALVALLLSAVTVVKVCAWIADPDSPIHTVFPEWIQLGTFILAFWIVPVVVAFLSVSASLRQVEATSHKRPNTHESIQIARRHLHCRILLPLLLAAYVSCLLATWPGVNTFASFNPWGTVGFLLGFGLFHSLFNWHSYRTCGSCLRQLLGEQTPEFNRRKSLQELGRASREILSGFGAGAIGGLLFYALMIGVHGAAGDAPNCHCLSAVIALGPPLFLMVVVLTGFVHVGLQGRLLIEAQREWWSSLGGWLLMYAVGWAAVFGTVLYGPYLVVQAEGYTPLVVGWIISVGGGLFAAHGSQTGDNTSGSRPSWWKELIVRFAPRFF
jgi:hypothetical protein